MEQTQTLGTKSRSMQVSGWSLSAFVPPDFSSAGTLRMEEAIRPPITSGKLEPFSSKIEVADWAIAEDQVSRDRE